MNKGQARGRGEEAPGTHVLAQKTHLHPVQLRVIVGLSEAGKHEVVRVLEKRPRAEARWGEHGGVQGPGRVVGVTMVVRCLLLMLGRGRGRRRRGLEILAGLVGDAQLHDGRRVDWSTISWGFRSR